MKTEFTAPSEAKPVGAIIVGFDGSDHGADALQLGSDLAAALDARLVVGAVYEHPPGELEGAAAPEGPSGFFADVFAAAEAMLPGVPFERRPIEEEGPVRGDLAQLADQEEAELLVIGSTHLGLLGRMISGTARRALIERVPHGVVVAPEGWARRPDRALQRIGVGYNGTDEAKLAMLRAGEIARRLSARLRLIAVAPFREPQESAALKEPDGYWIEQLRQETDAAKLEVESAIVMRRGRPATELAEESRDLDLLVVGARPRGPVTRAILGSVSDELLRTAHCPVLVIPGSAGRPREELLRVVAIIP